MTATSLTLPRRLMVATVASLGVLFASMSVAICARALPPGRHYEMVSPPYKGGYRTVGIQAVAMPGPTEEQTEGERVAFSSVGTFAGATANGLETGYLATRGSSDWSTAALTLPLSPTLPQGLVNGPKALSPSLDSVIFTAPPATYNGEVSERSLEPNEAEFFVQRHGNAPRPVYGRLRGVHGGRINVQFVTGSHNLCHVIVNDGFGQEEESEALLPEALHLNPLGQSVTAQLYELSAGSSVPGCGSDAPALRLVAVANENGPNGPKPLDPYCLPSLGSGFALEVNPISSDGSEVFFTSNANLVKPDCDVMTYYRPLDPSILYARLNGERTVQISTPIEADCAGAAPCHSASQQRAEFVGANEAGTHVFFTTIQPLTTGDAEYVCEARSSGAVEIVGEQFSTKSGCEDGTEIHLTGRWKRFGNDLYMATVGCPETKPRCTSVERQVISLTQVSHSPIFGERAEVPGDDPVVALSPDGERVYFVATGVLTEGANREDRTPVKGADNLYTYNASKDNTHFVTELCSGPLRSGEAVDNACPGKSDSHLWNGGGPSEGVGAQTTSNGEFLVFTSSGQLVRGDTDTRRDVYRYDARTETLERVSVGEDGYDANGNSNGYDASLQGAIGPEGIREFRAITEDGSRIVFSTAEPLSPMAVNGLTNAYEWHARPGSTQGEVSLVSNGSDERPVGGYGEAPVITPSGRDIFFQTAKGLLPQDTDGLYDVYDARLGAGFPEVAESQRACEGDACQGPLTNPAPLLVPGSVSQAPGENVTTPVPKSRVKRTEAKPKRKPGCRRGRERGAHRSCLRVRGKRGGRS